MSMQRLKHADKGHDRQTEENEDVFTLKNDDDEDEDGMEWER